MNHALIWALVISALGVVVVRRRTVAIGLVALQSLLLGAQAIAMLRAGRMRCSSPGSC